MLRAMFKVGAICALAQLWPLCVRADSFSLKQSVEVGRPPRALEVTLSEPDGLAISVQATRHALPARGVRTASVEAVRVAPDAAVTIVRASASNGEWVIVLGGIAGKELLLAERTDLHGDPGERRATLLSLEKTSDGQLTSLAVGTQFDGLSPCGGGKPPLLQRRTLDPKSLRFVAQAGSLDPPPELTRVTATALTAASQPRLLLLSATGSTTIDALTATPLVPHATVDGRAETAWPAAEGALALFRWSPRGLPIERFEIELAHRKAASLVTVYLENGAFEVSLPKPARGLDRFGFTPPAQVESGCVAIAVHTAEPNRAPLQIAELTALTRLDAPGGLDQLVSELVQDGPKAALAADLLAALGEPAARSIATRFDELSVRGQRRALKALAGALALPEAQAHVLSAARAQDEGLRQAALSTLARGQEPGAQGLRTLALEPGASGDAAVRALAAPDRHETPALLAALAAPGGADRPVLRRALITAARRPPFDAAVQAFLAGQPNASARVALALVAASAELPALGLALAEGALDVTSFPDRFRLSLAACQVGPSPALDAWLAHQADQAEEWMLRRAAYDALLMRKSPEATRLLDKIAHDPYPRVRAAAPALMAAAGKTVALRELAQNDAWPLVRVAAVQSLARVPQSRQAIAKSLEDGSRHVRAASITALAQQRAVELWPQVEQRLRKEDEWPVVKAAAIQFAAALCIQPARAPLTETARHALRPDASDDDRNLGLYALQALHDLGGEAAADARLIAERESASPQLKGLIAQAGPARCEAKGPPPPP